MKRIPTIAPLLCVLGAMELVVRRQWVPAYLLPSPTQIVHAFGEFSALLLRATRQTGSAALIGFLLSLGLGIGLACLLSGSRTLERLFYPYAVFFQTVPIISIAPLLVIWFGYGMPTVIASAVICSFFPVLANTLLGLRSTDPALVDLFRLYGARPSQRFWGLRFPFALPQILAGARIAAGLAVIGAIVGEFITGGGLGSVVDTARSQLKIDLVFAAVIAASVLGLGFYWAIEWISRRSLRHWHASEKVQNPR